MFTLRRDMVDMNVYPTIRYGGHECPPYGGGLLTQYVGYFWVLKSICWTFVRCVPQDCHDYVCCLPWNPALILFLPLDKIAFNHYRA
jgi:hypothetical protein